MKLFNLGEGEKETKEEDEREMKGEPEPIDYVLPSNIREYYRQLRDLDELKGYRPENRDEKIKIYEQLVDKAMLETLIEDKDYEDLIVEYSNKLTEVFKGSKEKDEKMKRKAYEKIAKKPKDYLRTARDFYGEQLEKVTETRREEIHSVLEEVEEDDSLI